MNFRSGVRLSRSLPTDNSCGREWFFHLQRIRCERPGENEPLPRSFLPHFATPDEANTMAAYVAGPLSFATNGDALRVEGSVVRSNF